MNAGLLTVLGKTGEGLASGMTEAIKYEILKRRDDALFQREKTLEEYRHGKRTVAEEKRYQRRKGEEETTYQRRRGEEKYQDELKEKAKEAKEAEKRGDLKSSYSLVASDGTSVIVGILNSGESKILYTGGRKPNTDAQIKAAETANKMINEGASLEAVNEVRRIAGLAELEEVETGNVIKTGGLWGLGTTKAPETKLVPRKSLLGGVPGTDITKKEIAEGESIEGGLEKPPTATSFDEIIEKIKPPEDKRGTTGLPGDGLLATKKPIKRTKMIGSAPEEIEAEKEAGKQEMIALANKAGVGAKAWKETWRLYGNIAKWLWGSYDNFVGEMLKSQKEARRQLRQ